MNHLHVTHITEGLQIVKYRAPLIRHKYNTNKATVTYTKHIHSTCTCLHKTHLGKICRRNLRLLLSSKPTCPNTEVTNTYT